MHPLPMCLLLDLFFFNLGLTEWFHPVHSDLRWQKHRLSWNKQVVTYSICEADIHNILIRIIGSVRDNISFHVSPFFHHSMYLSCSLRGNTVYDCSLYHSHAHTRPYLWHPLLSAGPSPCNYIVWPSLHAFTSPDLLLHEKACRWQQISNLNVTCR